MVTSYSFLHFSVWASRNIFTSNNDSIDDCSANYSNYVPGYIYRSESPFTVVRSNLTEDLAIPINGWKISCWPLESILLSTLESFYNQTSLNIMVSKINSSVPNSYFRALNVSQISYFLANDTIRSVVDRLFIENWVKFVNYSSYFSKCQPRFCQYVVEHRVELIYIITSLLGLYGGLAALLRSMVPYVIRAVVEQLEQRSTVTRNEATNTSKYGTFDYPPISITSCWSKMSFSRI